MTPSGWLTFWLPMAHPPGQRFLYSLVLWLYLLTFTFFLLVTPPPYSPPSNCPAFLNEAGVSLLHLPCVSLPDAPLCQGCFCVASALACRSHACRSCHLAHPVTERCATGYVSPVSSFGPGVFERQGSSATLLCLFQRDPCGLRCD